MILKLLPIPAVTIAAMVGISVYVADHEQSSVDIVSEQPVTTEIVEEIQTASSVVETVTITEPTVEPLVVSLASTNTTEQIVEATQPLPIVQEETTQEVSPNELIENEPTSFGFGIGNIDIERVVITSNSTEGTAFSAGAVSTSY